MTFVDTGGWYAIFVPSDAEHAAALGWLAQNRDQLITTDYVVDELSTLMRARGEGRRAIEVGTLMVANRFCQIERVQPEDFLRAWSIFSTDQDKDWSFTDCVSPVVMERLGISIAFAFDDHFRQFGTVSVVP